MYPTGYRLASAFVCLSGAKLRSDPIMRRISQKEHRYFFPFQRNSLYEGEINMETLSAVLILAAVVVGVILLIRLLSAPMRWIFKLLLNAVLGFVKIGRAHV